MLGGGHDVPWDRPGAERWFRLAAPRGHAFAQLMLGRYMARGLVGEPNIEEARFWFTQALGQGLAEAQTDLAGLPPAASAPPPGQPAPGLPVG
jgi:TPR repeat protein